MGLYPDVGILSFGSYIPEKTVSVHEVKDRYGISDELIERVQIECVHVAADHEFATDMAIKAAKKAMEKGKVKPEQIDLIIYSYISWAEHFIWADYGKIQHALGAINSAAIRLEQSCNAGIMALEYGCAKIQSNPDINTVLLVTAETWKEPLVNRWTCTDGCFFGDGASAVILQRGVKGSQIINFCNKTDGSLNYIWRIPLVGGTKHPITPEHVEQGLYFGSMIESARRNLKNEDERKEVGEKIVSLNIQTLKELLQKIGKSKKDVDKLVVYNVGLHFLKKIADSIEIPLENTSAYLAKNHGHIGVVDIFLNLEKMIEDGNIQKGDLVFLFSGGTGYCASSTAIQF
ncbi:3-oxoacyl-[acyl-carrier-protein] synthase-3 [Anaerovirgula multivorans]|uniref:3-oxoacyl-[acyl-carrier-protein] synthase-3 n=1 Tax=Anaerovirgula multivorans TaxID=312168 RepID=A0A239J5T5_9FIRM|nr:3-oxoacyl-[acyl-carrier-protein] synthase III C-terminal domain-containing protein [Anaerovirgula multivorans]SNT01217.1 3-oxoacyl-[acyl-carrier-protein] synthase-3 [Anaerovirgula multivorans]